MQPFEEIELQIWDYIDNRCSEQERTRIAALIVNDAVWKNLYEEITATNDLLKATEPEHTSMRFTKNVMETVEATTIAPHTAKYLNNTFIKGIAVFMLTGIVALLVYIIAAAGSSVNTPPVAQKKVNLDWISNPATLEVMGFLFVLSALVFIDTLLRKKDMDRRNAPL